MEIEPEFDSETLNENKVLELAVLIGDLKRKRVMEKFEAKLGLKRLLTSKQKKKVKQNHR